MNACNTWKNRLLDYALGDTEQPEVESHSKICPDCSAALDTLHEQQEQIDAGLRHLVRAGQPFPGFRARVLAASETRPVWGHVGWAGAVAALGVLVLAVLFLNPSPPKSDPAMLAAEDLSRWQSPTEMLLISPADEWLDSTPRLGEYYFSLEPASPEVQPIEWRK